MFGDVDRAGRWARRICGRGCTSVAHAQTRPHLLEGFWREITKGAKFFCQRPKTNKMYTLRSGKSCCTPTTSVTLDENNSSPDLRQSTIQFRKRRHPPAVSTEDKLRATNTENMADHLSPPKRHKLSGMSHNTALCVFPFTNHPVFNTTSSILFTSEDG